jgi:hypothetical protein
MGHRGSTRRIQRWTVALAFAASAGLAAQPVLGADALDQSYVATDTMDFVQGMMVAAQTYTAAVTGSLNKVVLPIGRYDNAGPLTVSIQTTAGGIPSGTVLASATVPLASALNDGTAHSVPVALPPSLSTAGTQYAIVLAAPAAQPDTTWLWMMDTAGSYAGGAIVRGNTGLGTWTIDASSDYGFATYVDPTPCAPGSWSTTGYGPCVPADAGHFSAGEGATSQAACDLGSYQPAAGSAACLPAPIGTYVDVTGAVAPTSCPVGTTTAGTGSTSIAACIADTTPPVITPIVTGTIGLNGWYTSDVSLHWSVVEPETPASLVRTLCVDQAITTDQAATTYTCAATSLGGSAGPVTVTIKRDATPPTISCSASPGILWPPNGRLMPVTVTVTTGGATAFTLVSVTASSGSASDITGWSTGTADTAGLLRASRSGSGGNRIYTLTYQATDDAGNASRCLTTVLVPHDMGRGA